MPKSRNDKLQGTLTLLVLRTLDTRGPLHGYGLCDHIRSVSDELLQVEEGSLYPARSPAPDGREFTLGAAHARRNSSAPVFMNFQAPHALAPTLA